MKTITGNNTYESQILLQKLEAEFEAENGEGSVSKKDGMEVDYNDLESSLMATSLFSAKTLVIVRSSSLNKELSEKLIENIEKLLDLDLVLYEPEVDKRGSLYKLLKKKTEFVEFKKLAGPELVGWVKDYAKIDGSTANYLIERVGDDQWRLSSELDKLAINGPVISRADIDLLVEPEPKETIFQLLDFAMSGNSKKAIGTYRELRKTKMEPAYVMSMIAWQLYNISKVSVADSSDQYVIAKEAGLNPFVVQKSQAVLKRVSKQRLKTIVSEATATDMKMKSVAINPDDLVEQLLLKISS